MRVQIQIKGLPRAAKLRAFAAHRLEAAIARFADGIQEASMWLGDINGPERGGVDKLCRVVLRLKNNSIVVIEDLGADAARVIDRVIDRLQQSVSRQLSRLAAVDRKGLRHNALLLPVS
jgi:putative sigma-54 modulation protein